MVFFGHFKVPSLTVLTRWNVLLKVKILAPAQECRPKNWSWLWDGTLRGNRGGTERWGVGGGCRKETPPKGHKAAVFRGRKHVAEGPEIIEFQWFKCSQPLSTIMFKQAIISQLLQSMWQCAYSPPSIVQYVLPCLCILHMGSCLYYTFLCKRLSGSPCCGIVKTNSCLFNVSGWWIDFNLM